MSPILPRSAGRNQPARVPVAGESGNPLLGRAMDARKLHQSLGVKEKFTAWLKRRLTECEFTEGLDYQFFSEISEKAKTAQRGRSSQECLLSLDAAKHVCLLERSETGHQIRQYFIESEKKLSSIDPHMIAKMVMDGLRADFPEDEKGNAKIVTLGGLQAMATA